MNELNQLMMVERSVFADMGGGGEPVQDIGKIIKRANSSRVLINEIGLCVLRRHFK